jgi:two-component system sensor histidine kinase/response regulator
VKLTADFAGLPPADEFWGDERRVRQILLNLLSNAVKFTPPGGEVWLRMQYEGNQAMIEVADTGIGIPMEKQHLLFEAFQQIDSSLNRQHEGTGLGLALTRQLVEMHGGTISFHSEVDAGTVFVVNLLAQNPN